MGAEPKLISLPVGKPVTLWSGAGYNPQMRGSITIMKICPRQDGLIEVFFRWEGDKPLSPDWVGRRRFMVRTKGDPASLYVVSSWHERGTDRIAVIVIQPVS